MKPYPKYKDSGIEWIGMVPEGWGFAPIRSFAKSGYKTFTDGDWIESPYIREQGIRLIQTGNIGIGAYREQGFRYIDEESFLRFRCTEVEAGDILICRLADPVGRACLAPNLGVRMITSVDVCILKPHCENDARFVVYGLSSPHYLSWMNAICRGGTRNRVSRSMLGSICLQKPPLKEQTAIAAYLDHKTTQIDNLISKKQKLIELLKEERAAIINQAVTKGLNPDVPMKNSGIEWLGEVPAHWEVKKLKWVSKIVNGSTPKSSIAEYWDGDIVWVTPSDISKIGSLKISASEKKITHEGLNNCGASIVPQGSIILTTRAPIGNLAIANTSLCTNQGCKSLIPTNVYSPYLFYSLFVSKDVLQSIGSGTTFKELSTDNLASFIIVLPPQHEQKQIAAYLYHKTTKIDQTITKIEKQIGLLKEFRTALISEVVTGKIDVRDGGSNG